MAKMEIEQQTGQRRLAGNLKTFAVKYEFPYTDRQDGQEAELGVYVSGGSKLITNHYHFDPSGDSYSFGWAERLVDDTERAEVLQAVNTTRPIIGLTERIIGNRLVVVGGRDSLKKCSDVEIQRCFQDDVARVDTHFRQTDDILKRLLEREENKRHGQIG